MMMMMMIMMVWMLINSIMIRLNVKMRMIFIVKWKKRKKGLYLLLK